MDDSEGEIEMVVMPKEDDTPEVWGNAIWAKETFEVALFRMRRRAFG
jgi:hypothetical protein